MEIMFSDVLTNCWAKSVFIHTWQTILIYVNVKCKVWGVMFLASWLAAPWWICMTSSQEENSTGHFFGKESKKKTCASFKMAQRTTTSSIATVIFKIRNTLPISLSECVQTRPLGRSGGRLTMAPEVVWGRLHGPRPATALSVHMCPSAFDPQPLPAFVAPTHYFDSQEHAWSGARH